MCVPASSTPCTLANESRRQVDCQHAVPMKRKCVTPAKEFLVLPKSSKEALVPPPAPERSPSLTGVSTNLSEGETAGGRAAGPVPRPISGRRCRSGGRGTEPGAGRASLPQAVLAAQRRGEDVETSKKWAAGQNKQHFITKNTAKLDRETEELHHDRVPLEVGKVIQQGRQSKGMTQKDLATKINEKPQVIADYESGRAIPNNQVMGKIERAIGLKLRGKDIGKPLETGPKGK
ncbi:endothelial differentiation-related factor 1 [Meleagris gallopavo]|nr:endothelial differentiation-related factor 1 [Meleagris gallopavo]